jgi:hypothetical protein
MWLVFVQLICLLAVGVGVGFIWGVLYESRPRPLEDYDVRPETPKSADPGDRAARRLDKLLEKSRKPNTP